MGRGDYQISENLRENHIAISSPLLPYGEIMVGYWFPNTDLILHVIIGRPISGSLVIGWRLFKGEKY